MRIKCQASDILGGVCLMQLNEATHLHPDGKFFCDFHGFPANTRAVAIVLFNELGEVLCVSRKNNPNDWGLPGGKVDPGEDDWQAIERETWEETGLEVYGLIPIFARFGRKYNCATFVGQYKPGAIQTKEAGVVKWLPVSALLDEKCTFHKYNKNLFAHLGII